jgi:hypothetical protein
MQIRTRQSVSADGYVTTPDGWPAQLADPAFVSGENHGRDRVHGQLRPRRTRGQQGTLPRAVWWARLSLIK